MSEQRITKLVEKVTELHEEDIYLQGPVTFSRRECWERHQRRNPTCDVCILIRGDDEAPADPRIKRRGGLMETTFRPLAQMSTAPADAFCLCERCAAVIPNRDDFKALHTRFHDVTQLGSLGFAADAFFAPVVQQGGTDG